MRYELRLTAYDVMDEVWVSTSLHETRDMPTRPSRAVLHWQVSVRGTGEQDPTQWTRDALVAALEALP